MALLVSNDTVIDHISGGLGSYTHSRDAELYALCAGLHLLLRNQPPPGVTQAVIVSDAALALRQLRRLQPDWGHSIVLTWRRMALEYLAQYPHMRILVMWGPSKETPSLATVDQLAKQARTRGCSPTCSLRFFRMALKNTQLQAWRTQCQELPLISFSFPL